MASKILNGIFERESSVSFNMTAVIDIVFLLIVFFALVFKFIEAENFPVAVPAGCDFAQSEAEIQTAPATVSVVRTDGVKSDFAVGAEKIAGSDYGGICDKLAKLIDSRLKNLPAANRVVTLRIDKDVAYSEAQYALAAIAKSSATDIRLSVIKTKEVSK
ncbi:MAG: biopolymer transporter ExbD [Sedimentisphaerales bacterium]|nr:biopolymer transporter ExbD [Sedimentisphaerales bacterium]